MNPRQAIEKLRSHGLSQADIARAAKANQSTISKIESGQRDPRYALGARLIKMAEGIELIQSAKGSKS